MQLGDSSVRSICSESEAARHFENAFRRCVSLDERLISYLPLLDLGFHSRPLPRSPILFGPVGAVGFVACKSGGEFMVRGDDDPAVTQCLRERCVGGVNRLYEFYSTPLPALALRRELSRGAQRVGH